MTESILDDLDEDELDELADKLSGRIGSRDKEKIKASMGLFKMKIETHEDLDTAAETFESIWQNRIEEIQDAESTTKRELEKQGGQVLLG